MKIHAEKYMRRFLLGQRCLAFGLIFCWILAAFPGFFGVKLQAADSASTPEGGEALTQAVALYYQGDFYNSLSALGKIVDLSKGESLSGGESLSEIDSARLNFIRLLREAGQFDSALAELQVLRKKYPKDPDYRVAFIKTACLAGKPELAVANVQTGAATDEELFWQGVALADLGRDEEALKALTGSLAQQSFKPLANYQIGLLYFNRGNYDQALEFFRRALTQDPNLTSIYYPLAQTYLGLKKFDSAYRLLQNAKSAAPWNQGVSDTLKQLTTAHPELVKKEEQTKVERRQVAAPPQVTPAEHPENIPMIRIGLVEKVSQLFLKTGAKFHLEAPQASSSYSGTSGTILEIRNDSGKIKAFDGQGAPLFTANQRIILSYETPGATTVLFDVEFGQGLFFASREDRIYRGTLEFIARNDKLTVVNRLNVEEYLYAVVPSEMSSKWPAAALAAQAIAARTYTFANLGSYESRGFDLLSSVSSQAYDGVTAETKAAIEAVNATRGRILTYTGKPIAAFFNGNNGGFTVNSLDLWGFKAPYLQDVPDLLLPSRPQPLAPEELAGWLSRRVETYSSNPNYSSRSSYRWTQLVSRLELENRLGQGDALGRITSIITTGRGISGVVKQVLIKGTAGEKTLKGDAIRSKLGGLRSNLFVVEPKMGTDGLPEFFIFTGGGWGHGIGMCQSGAAGMAAAGFSTADILAHYYPGTELTEKY